MQGVRLKLSHAHAHATNDPAMRVDIRVDARIDSE
jgi:hypothetical protein